MALQRVLRLVRKIVGRYNIVDRRHRRCIGVERFKEGFPIGRLQVLKLLLFMCRRLDERRNDRSDSFDWHGCRRTSTFSRASAHRGREKTTASRTGATSLLSVAPHSWDVAKVLEVVRVVTEEPDEDDFGDAILGLFD